MDRSLILPTQLSLGQALDVDHNRSNPIVLSQDAMKALENKNTYKQLVQYGSGCISWLSAAITTNQIIRIPIHLLGLIASAYMYGSFAKPYFLLKNRIVDSQLKTLKKDHCQSIWGIFAISVSHLVTFSLAFTSLSEKTFEDLQIVEAIAAGLCAMGLVLSVCEKV